ncbi:hypothetical protein [Thauera sinica]|uniref:Uncharacterized protein n=1 Tax=Thauera sinica TaxID=2665146 RepID=A0ABW1ARS0_9RHOO|nr:hypothetical protein [Thauera sp. K11]ATE60161.1 hypothetical protein CCZ27_09560 [Thauera sp. K11]
MDHPMDLPAAAAAKHVKRVQPEIGEDGKLTGKELQIAVSVNEVFASRLRDDVLTVITTDGQRLVAVLPQTVVDKLKPANEADKQ